MENFKLKLKKAAAFMGAAALAASFVTPALAAGLQDLPAPFVEGGELKAVGVVGGNAASIDVVGAMDVMASFAQVSTTTVAVGGSSDMVTYTGAAMVSDIGNDLNWGEELPDVKDAFDYTDLDVLAKGTLTEEDDDTDHTYETTITFDSGLELEYGNPDEDVFDAPVIYFDLVDGPDNDFFYQIDVEFNKVWDVTDFTDSEDFTILEKPFTIAPTNAIDEDVIMYASSETIDLDLGEEVTVDGDVLSVVGGNTDGSEAIIRVNGEQKTVVAGDSVTIGGVKIFAKDVFVTDIPELSVSATVFVGSEEYNFGLAKTAETYTALEINDDSVKGVKVWLEGETDDADDVLAIHFRVNPAVADPDTDWLALGESFEDLAIGTFDVDFAGVTPGLMDATRTSVMFARSGSSDMDLTFTNREGTMYTLPIFEEDTSALAVQEDLVIANTGAEDFEIGNIFFAPFDGDVVRVYEIDDIYEEDAVHYVDFVDLSTGEIITKKNTRTLGLLTLDDVDADAETISFDAVAFATEDWFTIEYEQQVKINFTDFFANVTEDGMTFDETPATTAFNFTFGVDSDDYPTVTVDDGILVDDKEGEVGYYVSEVGSYIDADVEDKFWANVYLPQEEADYSLYVAPKDAMKTTVEGGEGTSQQVNYIAPGVGMLDSDYNQNTPVVLFGGPAVNTVVADLIAAGKTQAASEYAADMALIDLVEDAFGDNAALIVAGWTGEDTLKACRVLANAIVGGTGALELTGSEVELNTGVSGYSQVTISE